MEPVSRIWLWLLASTLFLLIECDISNNDQQQLMPPNFSKICKVQNKIANLIRINCHMSSNDNQTWRLDILRNWINATGINQSNRFSYDLKCDQSGGSVSLPWPMKCPQLVEISIRNCNITDIHAEVRATQIHANPSQLTRLEIINSRMVSRIPHLLLFFSQLHNMTSDYYCLHDKTIEKLVYRNVSLRFENTLEEELKRCIGSSFDSVDLMSPDFSSIKDSSNETEFPSLDINPSRFINDAGCLLLQNIENLFDTPTRMRELEVSCNYENLRALDDSISDTLSLYHHRFLTKYNRFPVLEFLNYSYNYIDVIPDELSDWTFYFKVMKHMDLSHNLIQTLKFKSSFVKNLVNDTYINVQYNNITKLSPQDLQHLRDQSKTFIDIRNNPINCSCDLKDFIAAITKPDTFTGSLKKYDYIRNMTCHHPVHLEGRTLKSLTIDDLDCNSSSNTWIIPVVTVIFISLFFISLIIFAFIYRKEIRILFYTRLHIKFPGSVYVALGQKKYHAFVSYSNEDEDWVLDVLCKRLEDPQSADSQETSRTSKKRKSKTMMQFKLCLHGRDFIPGMTIIENIINSVTTSRHTVIILSANFVESRWAMEEFYQAYQQSVLERRRHLIIVIHGELPEDQMDPILKRCLKTFTYIKSSDKLFYDRLTYSLSTENRMTEHESSREEEILKSRNTTLAVEMLQDTDSGISNMCNDSLSDLFIQANTKAPVMSNTNSGHEPVLELTRL